MKQHYNMNVRGFINKYVKEENQARFLELMVEWDGDKSVIDSFYDFDLLEMKHKEAKEANGRR